MNKTFYFLVLLFALKLIPNYAQENCDFDFKKKEIFKLIELHKQSLQRGITPLFDFYTSSANDQRNIVRLPGNQIEFHYMGDRTLRFYVYSSGLDSQLKLYLLKDKELILEINERGVTEEISFYDYRIEEVNDFILEFDSTIDSDGCAVAIATVISPEFKSLLPASRDLNY